MALAFVGAGGARLVGVDAMVATYDMLGVGQWFQYLIGIIEIAGVVLLWPPGRQIVGADLLWATMVGAVQAHWLDLGRQPPRQSCSALSAPVSSTSTAPRYPPTLAAPERR
nr:DoxX family protein [Palleronia pontilimi]